MGHNLDSLMSSSVGQPMAQIFLNSFGQNGTLVMWSFIILVQYMMGSSTVYFLSCSPIVSLGHLLIMLLMIFVDARCLAPVLRLVCLTPY